MPPRRQLFKTKDGHSYTLWSDIHELMQATMPTYWAENRDDRRERGWMFRGQTNADWDLIPTLDRPPETTSTYRARWRYTQSFISALRAKAAELGLNDLSDSEYLAIAQHYGAYTPLLDFTWNLEVAAYFATAGGNPGEIGVIFGVPREEYEGLQNPLSPLGVAREVFEKIWRRHGQTPLPDIEVVEPSRASRIYAQEGVFLRVTPEKVKPLQDICTDRYFFLQRPNVIYSGHFSHSMHALPSRHKFGSERTYQAFLAVARERHPELFEKTRTFSEADLFPADSLSSFAEEWTRLRSVPTTGSVEREGSLTIGLSDAALLHTGISAPGSFADVLATYYSGDYDTSPYEFDYQREGRAILEALIGLDLDQNEVRLWLLWELLKRTRRNLQCTLKLGDGKLWGKQQGGASFVVIDRWLAKSYTCNLAWGKLHKGFWRITFGDLERRGGRRVEEISRANPIELPTRKRKSFRPQPLSNPHAAFRSRAILSEVESRLKGLDEGIIGSFLYDLHHLVLSRTGHSIEITMGLVETHPCLQASPLIDSEHAHGPTVIVRVFDRILGAQTHTAVCKKHLRNMSAANIDLMNPSFWTVLGLA